MIPKLLSDVLGYMLEAQYRKLEPGDYIDYIDFYKKSYFNTLSDDEKENYIYELKRYLSRILNESNIDYQSLMLKEADHCLSSNEETKKIFELIEKSF